MLADPAPVLRGYRVLYQPGVVCPACGHRGWHVGRCSAQCARCAAALPLTRGDAEASH